MNPSQNFLDAALLSARPTPVLAAGRRPEPAARCLRETLVCLTRHQRSTASYRPTPRSRAAGRGWPPGVPWSLRARTTALSARRPRRAACAAPRCGIVRDRLGAESGIGECRSRRAQRSGGVEAVATVGRQFSLVSRPRLPTPGIRLGGRVAPANRPRPRGNVPLPFPTSRSMACRSRSCQTASTTAPPLSPAAGAAPQPGGPNNVHLASGERRGGLGVSSRILSHEFVTINRSTRHDDGFPHAVPRDVARC